MSYGMICASGEIGLAELFPTTQPAEIMDITEFGSAPERRWLTRSASTT